MSIGKSSIARAVNATTEVEHKSVNCTETGVSTFLIDNIGILSIAEAPKDTAALKQSIEKRGVLCPVLVCVTAKGDIWLIDGHRRLYAARELGITQISATVINAANKSEANRIYTELSKTAKLKKSDNIHEEKFNVLQKSKAEMPVYLL